MNYRAVATGPGRAIRFDRSAVVPKDRCLRRTTLWLKGGYASVSGGRQHTAPETRSGGMPCRRAFLDGGMSCPLNPLPRRPRTPQATSD